MRAHEFFKGLNEKNVFFVNENRKSVVVSMKEHKTRESIYTMYNLKGKPKKKDYIKIFSYFFFYKIFKMKMFHDGLIQIYYPKETRVYESFLISDINSVIIEGPKSVKITTIRDSMNVEVR